MDQKKEALVKREVVKPVAWKARVSKAIQKTLPRKE